MVADRGAARQAGASCPGRLQSGVRPLGPRRSVEGGAAAARLGIDLMSEDLGSGPVAATPTTRLGWRDRLQIIVETMRDMSSQTEPQAMVRSYGRRIREMSQVDAIVSLSRRGLEWPQVRVTRFSGWEREINPWKEKHLLPLLSGGLFAELIYGEEPRIVDDLAIADDDPAAPFLAGVRSLAAIPHYDQGHSLNMVLFLRHEPHAFDPEEFPEQVWVSNLFGRATHNLVLAEELKQAYAAVDRELNVVADIQRSLLPTSLPAIPHLDLSAYYQTSKYAGGDYYDVFPLTDDRWGLLIADVSGHGTPAAVLMAITHSLAHAYPGPACPPSQMLDYVNDRLSATYTAEADTFVTAFYGVYDPAQRALHYASAGHNPPRLRRASGGPVVGLDDARGLPLGILPGARYAQDVEHLQVGDLICFYTDGITEAVGPDGGMYGLDRLDAALARAEGDADAVLRTLLEDLAAFTGAIPQADDQTVLIARVVG